MPKATTKQNTIDDSERIDVDELEIDSPYFDASNTEDLQDASVVLYNGKFAFVRNAIYNEGKDNEEMKRETYLYLKIGQHTKPSKMNIKSLKAIREKCGGLTKANVLGAVLTATIQEFSGNSYIVWKVKKAPKK